MVIIAGEITTTAKPEYERVIVTSSTISAIHQLRDGFDGDTCAVMTAIGVQSPDINQGVTAPSLKTRVPRPGPDVRLCTG